MSVKSNTKPRRSPAQVIQSDRAMDAAMTEAAADAYRLAIAHGQKLPVWRDGELAWADPTKLLKQLETSRPKRRPSIAAK